jgi:hypothetical protein
MIPALCCVCGTQREVSRQAVRGELGTRKLKCLTCGCMTTHAAVFGRPAGDWRERENGRIGIPADARVSSSKLDGEKSVPVGSARKAAAVAEDAFGLVRRFGVRVYVVDGLKEEVVHCPEQDIAFVRAGLEGEEMAGMLTWLLGEIANGRATRDGDG